MKKVAIIGTRGYPSFYGGFETAVRRLAPYLADHGWQVVVYGRPGATSDAADTDLRVNRVVTRGIEKKSLSTLTYGLTSTAHSLRNRPDAALVMNVANGYWLPLLRRAGIPTLVNVDGIEWDRAKWGRVAKSVFRGGAKMTAKFANELVFDAEAIADRWNSEFGRDGVFIPYGGDVPNTKLPVEPGLESREYALMVARFVPENTVEPFLEAASELSKEMDVVIVGSSGYGGPLDDAAKSLASSQSRVRWLGHVSDDRRLHSLWQHAGAYFHGHSVGGTNPALVQAMACGAPCVARDTVYNREVLDESAIFVQPTSEAIVSGIRRVVMDRELQSSLSRAALARAQQHYSWDLVNSRYDEALTRLALARA